GLVDGLRRGKAVNYKGKYFILFFYPLDFTFLWPTEIIVFSDHAEDFHKLGYEVLGISMDSVHPPDLDHLQSPEGGRLGTPEHPLPTDMTGSLSEDYGMLKTDEGIAYQGLFIIDGRGDLCRITVNDLPVVCSVDETL
ncbi:Peroxiredoxin-2, partial [Saguinus oedipus]